MHRKPISLGLLLLAFVALIPGVTQPVLSITGSVDKAQLADLGKQMIQDSDNIMPMIRGIATSMIDGLDTTGSVNVFAQERSILGTVRALWDHGNWLVGFLIMLFSIIVPVCKGGLIVLANTAGDAVRERSLRIASAISKWSMADVFVIGVMVAFLAANASGNAGQKVEFAADFGSGFYFFVAFCLLSIASAQLMPTPHTASAQAPPASTVSDA